MSGNEEAYYWDSCILLAWLKDETSRKPGEMDGVREYIERLKRREISIMTSVITFTEVYRAKLPVGTDSLFEDLFKRTNVGKIGVDVRIARLARDLRDYYAADPAKYGAKTLSGPDSIHLATAVLYRAKEFHTFDERPNRTSLALIPLSGDVGGHKLTICKPVALNPSLDLR